jgi:hypothetical protein
MQQFLNQSQKNELLNSNLLIREIEENSIQYSVSFYEQLDENSATQLEYKKFSNFSDSLFYCADKLKYFAKEYKYINIIANILIYVNDKDNGRVTLISSIELKINN